MQYYDYYFPDYPVEYYDIWNEPDHPYFWTGTYNQLLELFYRAYNVIKLYKPEAKVVGPSISWFRPGYSGVAGIIDFLVDLEQIYGVRLDAISWHENGGFDSSTEQPDNIPTRAQYLRSQIQTHFPSNYTPEFHVNEFMGKQVHLSPGWNVGFLYYLEKAYIDRAMRSCWWVYSYPPIENWCDCWAGLNGLIMSDGETPQPAYWVWQTIAQMKEEIKLDDSSSDEHTNVIAIRNTSTNIINLLIGRYLKTTPNDVIIHIEDYSFSQNALVRIEKVPNDPNFYLDPPIAKPMPEGPEIISNEIVEVINESIQITIDDYIDGDAYIITIYPPPSKPSISGLSSGKPNTDYNYKFLSETPSGSDIYYYIDWGDGNTEDWLGPYESGEICEANHSWTEKGNYEIKVKAKDINGLVSDWSDPLLVTMPRNRVLYNSNWLNFLDHFSIIKEIFLRMN